SIRLRAESAPIAPNGHANVRRNLCPDRTYLLVFRAVRSLLGKPDFDALRMLDHATPDQRRSLIQWGEIPVEEVTGHVAENVRPEPQLTIEFNSCQSALPPDIGHEAGLPDLHHVVQKRPIDPVVRDPDRVLRHLTVHKTDQMHLESHEFS